MASNHQTIYIVCMVTGDILHELVFIIAHFQKEWPTGARKGSRSIRGSFGGAFARAQHFFADASKVSV